MWGYWEQHGGCIGIMRNNIRNIWQSCKIRNKCERHMGTMRTCGKAYGIKRKIAWRTNHEHHRNIFGNVWGWSTNQSIWLEKLVGLNVREKNAFINNSLIALNSSMVGELVFFFALRFLNKSPHKELQSIKPKSMQMQNVLIIYHHTCVLFLSQIIVVLRLIILNWAYS